MKMLLPIGLAILGLGAGVGAGMALKPAPEAQAVDACADAGVAAETHGAAEAPAADGATAACPTVAAANPLEPAPASAPAHGEDDAGPAVVALESPFVVPVFGGEKVIAMVVVSIAVEISAESETAVEAVQPRLRDTFLAAMFRHANSGGFDGAFTTGQKMEDLRSALLVAAQTVFTGKEVTEVLITEIARQDV